MRKIAVIGGGAIGSAMAAYLTNAGQDVGLWSRSFDRHRRIDAGHVALTTTGAVTGEFSIAVIPNLDRVADYEFVIVALPATAYADVLPPLAANSMSGQTIIVSGSLSLAPLWLREMAQQAGRHPTLISWGTTLLGAGFQGEGVLHIPFIRKHFDIAALPADRTDAAVALCAELFGISFSPAGSILEISLSNVNPIAHAGQLMVNFSRIDKQERWPLFENFTTSGVNIAETLDAERLRLAAAFGFQPRSLQRHYAQSYDVPDADVAAMARAISDRGSRSLGPSSIGHRHLVEDMPYGLVFLERLAARAGLAMPVTASAITLLEVMSGIDLRGGNRILDRIITEEDDMNSILVRCLGATPIDGGGASAGRSEILHGDING